MNNYRSEIDGLRAIAVVAVIIFHLNSYFLVGGYYGVDVFFVISGYLITGILIKDIKNNTFSLSNFWLRRIKRLVPNLLVVILTTSLILPFLIFKVDALYAIKNDVLPAIFSFFNFHAFLNFGDYWGSKAENSFFLHTWSLSLEEQFYLIYPFILLFINRFFKSFIIPLILLTVISLILFLVFLQIDSQLTFYMLPFRLWELSIGGVIACLGNKINLGVKNKNILSGLGLLLIFSSYFFASSSISSIAILAVLGTCLVLLFCSGNLFLGKLLGNNILVHFGKLSYSLYLWHWPIIVLFKNLEYYFLDVKKIYVYLLILTITYIVSVLSYHLVENRFRNYKYTPRVVIVGVLLCFTIIVFFRSSKFDPYYKSRYNSQIYFIDYFDISPTQALYNKEDALMYNVDIKKRLNTNSVAFKKEGIITRINNEDPKVLIMGDSHGTMWAKTLQEIFNDLNVSSSFYTMAGADPFFNLKNIKEQKGNHNFSDIEKELYAKSIISNLKKWDIESIIIGCRWEYYTEDENSKNNFEALLSYLDKNNIKVIIINQIPLITLMKDKNAAQYFSYLNLLPKDEYNLLKMNQYRVSKSNEKLEELIKKYKNVSIFDIFSRMTSNGLTKVTHNNEVLYFDDDHLSYYATQLYKNDFKNFYLKNRKE